MKITKKCKTKVCVGEVHGTNIKRYKGALVVAQISFETLGNQLPRFSITGGVHFNYRADTSPSIGGCIHDILEKVWPRSIKPFTKFHLWDMRGPMHYIPNSLFWAGFEGFCDGEKNSPPNFENFKGTAAWPEMTEKEFSEFRALSREDATAKLEARLPALKAEFAAAMRQIFGEKLNLETGKLED